MLNLIDYNKPPRFFIMLKSTVGKVGWVEKGQKVIAMTSKKSLVKFSSLQNFKFFKNILS